MNLKCRLFAALRPRRALVAASSVALAAALTAPVLPSVAPVDPVVGAHEADPANGIPIYLIARGHAADGNANAAAEWLRKLVPLGWDYGVDAGDFAPIADDPGFRQVAATLDARVPRIGLGASALRFTAADLRPEGIAHDPRSDAFLVGSGRLRKIVAVTRDGKVADRVAPGSGGVLAIAGIRVDAARGHLWAASSSAPFMSGLGPQDEGRAALVRYDLASGRPERTFAPPDRGAMLNDLAVGADGTAYVTDTANGAVLRTGADATAVLARLVAAGTFLGPNGIAVAPDGAALFVADFHGVSRVRIADGAVQRLTVPAGVRLGGIDGLYVVGPRSLVAVQNLVGSGRVWRLELDAAGSRVEVAEILVSGDPRFRNPTTGAVVGGDFFLLADPARSPSGGHQPAAGGSVTHTILRLPLAGRSPTER